MPLVWPDASVTPLHRREVLAGRKRLSRTCRATSADQRSPPMAILTARIVTGCIDREPAMNDHTHHEKARREAFSWYVGDPPSPDEARRHFISRARQHPE